jgi:hypothetical protein
VILSLVFSALTTVLFAQKAQVKNLEKYDKAWLHFGFLLGTNKTDFKLVRSDNFYKSDSAQIVQADGQAGFNIGIISNIRIIDNLDFRFIPDIAFSQRNLNYTIKYPNKKESVVVKKVESTFIEFPVELKFKSDRINNYRIYVTGGVKYMIDLGSQAKVENKDQIVKLQKYDYGYSIGFGMDFYMPLFKFAPEIKMFQGIPNTLAKDPAVYTTSLSSLKSRIFTFSLTFE